MPIGPVTPGSYTTVTPDVLPAEVSSIQAPSPTMPVVAADIAALTLKVLNIKSWIRDVLVGNQALALELIDTVTFFADVNFHGGGTVDFTASTIVLSGTTTEFSGTTSTQFDAGSTVIVGGVFQSAGTNTWDIYSILMHGDFECDCDASFDAGHTVTIDASLAINGVAAIAAASVVTNNGKIVHGSGGHINLGVIVGATSSHSYSIDGSGGFTYSGNTLHFRGSLGGDITYRFRNSGATIGAYVDIITTDCAFNGHNLILHRDDDAATSMPSLRDATGFRAARIYFDGTNWRRAYYHGE